MNNETTNTQETEETTPIVLEFPESMTVIPGETFPVTIVDERPFLTTHLNDYSVEEGLLLLILLLLIIRCIVNFVKEGFYWLW